MIWLLLSLALADGAVSVVEVSAELTPICAVRDGACRLFGPTPWAACMQLETTLPDGTTVIACELVVVEGPPPLETTRPSE